MVTVSDTGKVLDNFSDHFIFVSTVVALSASLLSTVTHVCFLLKYFEMLPAGSGAESKGEKNRALVFRKLIFIFLLSLWASS